MRLLTTALKATYWVLVLVIALGIFVYFVRPRGLGVNAAASLDRTLTGTAYRPFAYRVLMPLAANLLSPILPRDTAFRIGTDSETVLGRKVFRDRLNGSQYPSQVVLILIMMYLSLVGFAVTVWYFTGFLGYGNRLRYLMPPLFLLGCVVFFGFGYTYDFTTLFLFSLGLLLMARRNWAWFLIIFALATLNKETAIFLVVVFALYFFSRLPRSQFLALGACQLGLYGVIEGGIRFVFRNNPGDAFEWHLDEQLPAFREIAQKTPWLLLIWAAAVVVIAMLVLRRWNDKPAFIRVALSIFPFFLILFILWAHPLEIRDMLEVYPVVAFLMLPPPNRKENAAPGAPGYAT